MTRDELVQITNKLGYDYVWQDWNGDWNASSAKPSFNGESWFVFDAFDDEQFLLMMNNLRYTPKLNSMVQKKNHYYSMVILSLRVLKNNIPKRKIEVNMGASLFLFCLAILFIIITGVYVHVKNYGMAVCFAFISIIDIIFSAVKYLEAILNTYLGG